MVGRTLMVSVVASGLLMVAPSRAAGQALPDGVTEAMIEEGGSLFSGAALCSVCHGPGGTGMPGLGPNLTDDEWLHGDGTFDFLVVRITTGVPADESKGGLAMAPRGGSSLTDEQVRAVAAYVWSLRRGA